MFSPALSPIIVGLEIGTSKVCAVVGDLGAEGALNIVGVGQAKSRGVRKGEIVDPAVAEEDMRNAIAEAEQMADVEIRSVCLGVTGSHLRGLNNRGVHPVVSADREIMEEDAQDALRNAKVVNMPAETEVLHAIRQHFLVDGQSVSNPVGMSGGKLEVDVHVVAGNVNRLRNSIRAVRNLQLEVDELAFTGLASSLAVLTGEQKEMGALVIDLGAGTTDYAVYSEGVIKHTGVLAVGGDHLTNDLAHGLKVPLSRAEQLKIEHGAALLAESAHGRIITITNELGLPLKTINLEHLQRIMALRLQEILEVVAEDVRQTGLLHYLSAGVFLCGGGARIAQIDKLAGQIFPADVHLGKTNSISGLKSALDQPEFATAIGLVKFRSFKHKARASRGGFLGGLRGAFEQIRGRT